LAEDPGNPLRIDGNVTVTIQRSLKTIGLYAGEGTGDLDSATKKALDDFVNIHNFRGRMSQEGKIWKSILDHLKQQAKASG
jgi:hypothetical protein